jgi:HTH-type transcriptional regulator/antitoxin HigA
MTRKTKLPTEYLELIQRFPLLPIQNDAGLRQAEKVLDELSIIDEDKLTPSQGGYLQVLTDLVERYEEDRHPIANTFADGIDALRYLVEQHSMTASDLGRLLGNRQLGAALLRRQRQLSKAHISKLAAYFAVSTDLFMQEPSAASAA